MVMIDWDAIDAELAEMQREIKLRQALLLTRVEHIRGDLAALRWAQEKVIAATPPH